MTEEKSTSQEEELDDIFKDEEEKSTPDEKEGSKSSEEKSEEEEPSESEKLFQEISKETGKTIKSKEDVVKALKQQAKDFSKAGQEKEKKEESTQEPKADEDILEIFYDYKPKAELVKDDLKEIAKAKGISEIKVWKTEKWLRDKAEALAEDEVNKGKVGDPSQNVKGNSEDKEQKEFNEFYKKNLPPGFEA